MSRYYEGDQRCSVSEYLWLSPFVPLPKKTQMNAHLNLEDLQINVAALPALVSMHFPCCSVARIGRVQHQSWVGVASSIPRCSAPVLSGTQHISPLPVALSTPPFPPQSIGLDSISGPRSLKMTSYAFASMSYNQPIWSRFGEKGTDPAVFHGIPLSTKCGKVKTMLAVHTTLIFRGVLELQLYLTVFTWPERGETLLHSLPTTFPLHPLWACAVPRPDLSSNSICHITVCNFLY